MSVTQTESTLREYLDALLNGGDFGAFFSDDVLWTTMETGDEVRGRDAVRDFIVALHRQLFDASPELRNVTFGDGIAALEAVFVGRHVAEFAGVPPTGAMVRMPYTVFYDIDGAKITALRAYFPMAAMIQELQTRSTASAN
ncbi:MAG TPA: ester cyclase [Kribbella sp.]